ncbi:rhodanese-like domain-containing protein [Falsibacillus albus]|uniref:Rhodanese-like domain-containing protein n=1 Tax=Falsibacillus albus TaxID=2478915 RepID=A0A3L7JLD2_9BACI|nr:rhodanese-like domain-containing protein [Falsibacillus albus]RLQ91627.1 rhodanese-like domain-containing protein [Falsibacillus albus]
MKNMTAAELQNALENNEALNIIDVRETEEVKAGKIPGAVNVPLSILEFKYQDLDKAKPYIIVCRSGGRSAQASQFLEGQGFDVTNMSGGMMSWNGTVE